MAEEKKNVKPEQKKKPNRFVAWCKALPKRISRSFRNMVSELKKVTWPSKRKLIFCSVTVLVFMLFMGVVIGLLDMGASALVRLLVV